MGGFHVFVLGFFGEDGGKDIDFFGFFGLVFGDVAHFGHDIESFMLASDEGFVAVFVVRVKDAWVIGDGGDEGALG